MSKCYFRNADINDLVLLYEWANDPEVRQNSFSTGEISIEEHTAWFHKLLEREDARQYIFMEDKNAVGQVRLTIRDDVAEIGYSIAPGSRGKGYGKLMIKMLTDIIKKDLPQIKTIVAEVKTSNIASQRAFLGNGYLEKCLVYEMPINE